MFPKLFTIPAFDLFGRHWGPLSPPTYGVLLVAALLGGLWLTGVMARRAGLPDQKISDLTVSVIIGGLIGAKALLVIVDYDQYKLSTKSILEVLQSGGVFYGGLLGALPVAWYFVRRYGLPLLPTLDVLAPGVALGQAIGRLGCLAAGCCYGKPSTMPWALIFTNEDAHNLVGIPTGIPLHPSQLYESLATALLCVFLVRLSARRSFDGQIVLTYMGLYAIIRFALEIFRGDPARGTVFGDVLSTSQFIAILVGLAALFLWPTLSKRPREVAIS